MVISVIVSVYNLEDKIRHCLDSLINQTMSDFEVICINDCSIDNSLNVLREYSEKHPFIRIIDNEMNVGAGLSRHYGIKAAQGDYITFVDGDDTVEPDYLETLYSAAIEHNADLVSSGINKVKNGEIFLKEQKAVGVYYGTDKMNVETHPCIYLLGRLINIRLFDNFDYSPMRYIEDTPVLIKLLYYANKSVVLDYYGYNYQYNEASLTNTSSYEKHFYYGTVFQIDICQFNEDKPEWKECLSKVKPPSKGVFNTLIKLNKFDLNDCKEKYPDAWKRLKEYYEL